MADILYSRILGEQPKHLLIFHGLFGQSDNWNTVGKKLAENYTTHLVDLRNHGRSFHSDDMSFHANNQDIKNYLDHFKIEQAYFLGHSLGGRIVMDFALNNPDLVEKLIVADMSPKEYPPHHQGIIKALQAVDFDEVKNRNDVDEILKKYIPQIGVRQFLLKNVYLKEKGKYAFRFNLKVLSEHYNELISNAFPDKNFDKPALFLGGEKSDYITEFDVPLIRNYFPQAEIKKIKNSGHWLHAENPNDFLNEVFRFLESNN